MKISKLPLRVADDERFGRFDPLNNSSPPILSAHQSSSLELNIDDFAFFRLQFSTSGSREKLGKSSMKILIAIIGRLSGRTFCIQILPWLCILYFCLSACLYFLIVFVFVLYLSSYFVCLFKRILKVYKRKFTAEEILIINYYLLYYK